MLVLVYPSFNFNLGWWTQFWVSCPRRIPLLCSSFTSIRTDSETGQFVNERESRTLRICD